MALDARTRSSIYGKLAPILGADDANALMSQFASLEADELVTRHFLRAELAELRTDLRGEIGGLRAEMVKQFHQQNVRCGGALAAATALLATIGVLG